MSILDDEKGFETDSSMRGQLAPGRRKDYIFAGKATITVLSPKTGVRFTYKIRKKEVEDTGQKPIYFVSLLSGPDNNTNYTYLGTIFPNTGFRLTSRSKAGPDAQSVIAFKWISSHIEDKRMEVWHEGSCGRCGRKLTVPESIDSGFGPVCVEKGGR